MLEVTDRRHVSSASPFEPVIGFSRAVRVGDRVLVSGSGPVQSPGRPCPEEAGLQARRCFTVIEEALRAAGASLNDVVRTRLYLTSSDDAEAVGAVHHEVFDEVRPAATMVVVAGLLDPAWKVEIEAEAVVS
jgi:enamine deaminase RidA (YjgF/YER057c/UK114 family)